MENQLSPQSPPNYFKRRIAVLFVFAIFFLMLGRHLTFLPTINLNRGTSESNFQSEVEKIIKKKNGFYSVYYKNLKTEESFGINENQIETAASVNKLPIIAALYYLDKTGKIDLDDKITIQEDDVQDYGTGSIRYQEMPQTYSLRNLAKLALNQSDNTAAHVISLKLGEENIQYLVNTWGMNSTNMINNKTTVKDMGTLMQKINNGDIANGPQTRELLEFMTNTEFEDRLAKNIKDQAIIQHKTGDGEGFVHDVGIIRSKDGKNVYFLGVMTSDIGQNEKEAKDTIGEISKKIFEGLNN